MHRYGFLILLFSYNVFCISENCVTYNFEDNQKVNFTNTYGICRGMSSWDVGKYSTLSIDSPHRDSNIFITPRTTLSCISSFKFSVTGSATLELNVYMAPTAKSDQITVLVFQSLPGANDATVGNAVLSPNDINFVPGWQTMRVRIVGIGTHEGYITLLGMASLTSVVLVDSFRYVAPTYDIDSCIIYPDEISTIEIPTETSTIIPTTIPGTETSEIPTARPVTIVTIPTSSTDEQNSEIPRQTVTIIPMTTERPLTTRNPTTFSIPETVTSEVPTTEPVITTPVKSSSTTVSATEIPTTRPVTNTPEKPSTVTKPT
ncbi:jg3559, partial [Pararge aegeria aegeria]